MSFSAIARHFTPAIFMVKSVLQTPRPECKAGCSEYSPADRAGLKRDLSNIYGYYYTDPLPLKLTSLEPKYLISNWLPSVADKLFGLDPDDKAIVYGVNSL